MCACMYVLLFLGSSSPSLVLSGKVLEIEPESSTTGSIILPCYVSHPSTSVSLFKDVEGVRIK